MRILITGGGGFVGSHLVASQLRQNHIVRTIDLNFQQTATMLNHPRLQVVVGDVTDSALMASLLSNIDIVYHLASAHLDTSLSDQFYRAVNVDATRSLLEAAHAAGVGRFVHCSTNGVLGSVEQPPADEESVCSPTNIYERTKLQGENVVLEYAASASISVVVARPSWIYGPRCPRTAKLMRTVAKGRFLMFGDGATLRHPIYVADAVSGLESCAESGHDGQVYFIVGPQPVTLTKLVQSCASVQSRNVQIVHLPISLGIAATYSVEWGCSTLGVTPPVTRRTMDFFTKTNAYSGAKAARQMGFTAQTDLEEGLRLTHEWMAASRSGSN